MKYILAFIQYYCNISIFTYNYDTLIKYMGNLTKLGEFEFRYTPSGRKLKFEKLRCICGKEFFKRTDIKSISCGCVSIEKSKKEIIIGKEYNSIIPIKEIEQWVSKSGRTKRRQFECKCLECGNNINQIADRIGKINNCGCKVNFKHGMCFTRIYNSYSGAKRRCQSVRDRAYKNYGGRGIKFLWNSFEEFYKDMGESYKEGLEIDRIDVNGNYCKDNCRWVTDKEQSRNKRNTIRYNGESLADVCENLGKKYSKVYKRVHELGWDINNAIYEK